LISPKLARQLRRPDGRRPSSRARAGLAAAPPAVGTRAPLEARRERERERETEGYAAGRWPREL